MSTSVNVVDPDKLKETLADVRSDKVGPEGQKWVIVGHVNNSPNDVDVISSDTTDEANLAGMLSHLQDDQVMYCLLQMKESMDMTTAVKFVYIHWIGENVPFVKRGRFGVVHGSVVEHFNPHHVSIETGSLDDLTEESIQTKLAESSGTKSHVIEWSEANGRQHRGFTQHQITRNNNRLPQKMVPGGATTQVAIDDELSQAIKDVRSDSSDTTWILAGFECGNVKSPLVLVSKGSGSVDEIRDLLADDQPQFVLLRTSDVVDEINTVKFVYIQWVGENTKPMIKAKISAYKGDIEDAFGNVHVGLYFTNRFELDEEVIKDKVSSGSGSKISIRD